MTASHPGSQAATRGGESRKAEKEKEKTISWTRGDPNDYFVQSVRQFRARSFLDPKESIAFDRLVPLKPLRARLPSR